MLIEEIQSKIDKQITSKKKKKRREYNAWLLDQPYKIAVTYYLIGKLLDTGNWEVSYNRLSHTTSTYYQIPSWKLYCFQSSFLFYHNVENLHKIN